MNPTLSLQLPQGFQPLRSHSRHSTTRCAASPGPAPKPENRPLIRKPLPASSAASSRPQVAENDKWTTDYQLQTFNDYNRDSELPFLLPMMSLSKTKLPTETVQLQAFEPRYRLMFKLVSKSRSKRFGVIVADSKRGIVESVGTLCEMTHFIPIPEKRKIFISARAIGRFEIKQLLSDKPFLTAECSLYQDEPPAGVDNFAHLSVLEQRVWQAMLDVRTLATKLFANSSGNGKGAEPIIGDEVFTLETRRFCPDPAVRDRVKVAAGSDPDLLVAADMAFDLSNEDRKSETLEFICSDTLKEFDERERQEMFSFALARALEMDQNGRSSALLATSTAARLLAAEELVLEGRNYLAARSSLKDLF